MITHTPSPSYLRMVHRQAICDYLADLPLLDRQVLFQKYARKEKIPAIAAALQITPLHVQRIVSRTNDFTEGLDHRKLPPARTGFQVTRIAA